DAFSPDDEQLLVTIAGHLATAIEKIRLLDALRESESKHRTLVEQLPAITYEVTLGNTVGQNRTTYISPQVESILGFTAEEWMADPGLWIKQIHPDDRERVVAEVVARDNSSESLDIEYRVLTRAGRVRWFRNQYALARANLNQPGRLHGLMLDITERKQAEEALQASETRFRALIENSADAIALTSADGTIVFASPAHTLILGYAHEEIVGRSGLELIHPDDAVLGANALGQLLQTPGVSLSIQLRERHKDGSWRWLEGTAKNLLADPDVQAIVTNFRDITERKQAEARLREAEERYRLLVEQLPAIIYVIEAGLEGKTLYVSPQIESILGFTPEEWLADPDIWDRQLHPDDSDRTQAGHKISWETGNFRAEYRLLSKDGRVVWLRDESRAVLDADGRVLHMQGIAYDITERKQAEMQILLLKSAVEQSSASIVITNVAGVIEYVNPGFTELTGYSAEETIGQNPRFLKSGLTPPEEHKRLWEAITAGNQWRGEFCNRKKNGELYWELATISPITDDAGKSINFVAVKDDITDRKQAAEALRQSEACYRAVVEDQTEYICRYLPDGTLTFVNDAYCRSTGKPLAEILGQSFLSWVSPEERERLIDHLASFTPQQPIREIEQRDLGPDGNIRWRHWTDRAIFDEQGRAVEFQGTGRNITERKQREQELALLNEISQQLIKLIAPEAIFETLFNAIGRVLDNRNLYIALYDETTGVVSFPLYTVDGERRPVASRPVGNGLTEHILRTKEPMLIRSDVPTALRDRSIAPIGRESACYLGVPMLSGERAIGVLAIQDYERDAVYTERHVELFTTIAAQAAFALENARLFAAQARRVHELDTIAAVSAALRSAPTRADMLPIILDQVIDLMNCDTAALAFVSPVTGELVIEMGRGELASSTVGESFKIGEGIGGYVAATGQPYVANDLHNDPRIVKTHLLVSTRALACVPLIAQAQTIGVLWVGRAHTEVNQDTFTQDEVHLITAIADIAANAVRRAALHEETRRRVERLQALHTIDIAIGSSLDLHLTLNILLDQTLAQLEIAAACIFLF
ncbi:MAG TPA: PAS domain S-box protein, partial [Anaerolineales bacterium]|nr:PAS domain S-box protein [Anaerolineales bacterium]